MKPKHPLEVELHQAKSAGNVDRYDQLLIRAADAWEIPARATGTGKKRRMRDNLGRQEVEARLRDRGYDL